MKLTDDAASMIADLAQELPDGAGLRIAPRDDHEALAMGMTEAPGPDDVVIRAQDAQVFLAPVAQLRLEDATLDARANELGSAFFLQP